MNRLLRAAIVGWLSTAAMVAVCQEIQVVVHGSPVLFAGQGPIMSGGRVLVPLRGVLEKLGAEVGWDPSTQTVTARRAGTDIKLAIGQNTAAVNGESVTLDVPAQIVNGSTMVPLRFVGESLGERVKWFSAENRVNIDSNADPYKPPVESPPKARPRPTEPVPPKPALATVALQEGVTVLTSVNSNVDSSKNYAGQRISLTILPNDAGIPDGSRIEGYAAAVSRKSRAKGGSVMMHFNQLVLTDGHSYPINVSLVGYREEDFTKAKPVDLWIEAGTRITLRFDKNVTVSFLPPRW